MSEHYEDVIAAMSDAELVQELRNILPEKVPFGEMVGAPYPYCHQGPAVYADPESYLIEEAANRLERYAPVRHGRWVHNADYEEWAEEYICSECNRNAPTDGDYRQVLTDYCPHCGTIMDKGGNRR